MNLNIPTLETAMLENMSHPVHGEPIKIGMIKVNSYQGIEDLEQVLNVIETASSQYDIIVTPERFYSRRDGPVSKIKLDQYLDRLKAASTDSLIIACFNWQEDGVMYNTTFGLYQGKELFKHNKNTDGGEKTLADAWGLKVQLKDEEIEDTGEFEWEGINCLLDICSDAHAKDLDIEKDHKLYFLVACGFNLPREGYPKEGGYAIVVDGYNPACTVYRNIPREHQD